MELGTSLSHSHSTFLSSLAIILFLFSSSLILCYLLETSIFIEKAVSSESLTLSPILCFALKHQNSAYVQYYSPGGTAGSTVFLQRGRGRELGNEEEGERTEFRCIPQVQSLPIHITANWFFYKANVAKVVGDLLANISKWLICSFIAN